MALAPRTTRDGNNQTFSINFEDNGNPSGPQTPVSFVVGPALAALESSATALNGTLTVQFATAQEITGTLDVVDGSPRITRVARHVNSTGSAVQAAAANASRTYLDLFNGSDTDIWYRFDGTAAIGGAGSILLRPGDREIYDGARVCPTGAISTICGASGKTLSVWEA